MPTVPEFLRHDLRPGDRASVVLRSGHQLSGVVEEVDLVAYVVRIDGWALRVEEIAGARCDTPRPVAAA
jgi:hypothetical protein